MKLSSYFVGPTCSFEERMLFEYLSWSDAWTFASTKEGRPVFPPCLSPIIHHCLSPCSAPCFIKKTSVLVLCLTVAWGERKGARERGTVGEEYEASGGSPHGLWKKQDNISMSVIIEWPPQSHIQLSGEQEADGRRRYDEEEDIREWSALEKSATSHRWESAWIKITHPCVVRLHLRTQMWTQSGKKHLVGCFVRVLNLWLLDYEIVRWFTY